MMAEGPSQFSVPDGEACSTPTLVIHSPVSVKSVTALDGRWQIVLPHLTVQETGVRGSD